MLGREDNSQLEVVWNSPKLMRVLGSLYYTKQYILFYQHFSKRVSIDQIVFNDFDLFVPSKKNVPYYLTKMKLMDYLIQSKHFKEKASFKLLCDLLDKYIILNEECRLYKLLTDFPFDRLSKNDQLAYIQKAFSSVSCCEKGVAILSSFIENKVIQALFNHLRISYIFMFFADAVNSRFLLQKVYSVLNSVAMLEDDSLIKSVIKNVCNHCYNNPDALEAFLISTDILKKLDAKEIFWMALECDVFLQFVVKKKISY